MRILDQSTLEKMGVGAALLGSGGGGDFRIGIDMAQKAIRENGPVRLISIDEISNDAIVVSCGMLGDPSCLKPGHQPDGTGLKAAFTAVQSHIDQPIAGVMPIEGAGANAFMAIVLAARTGLPVVDVDTMGRAFPKLSMRTYTIHGLHPRPAALGTESGKATVIYPHDISSYEIVARSMVGQQEDGFLALVDYPLEVTQVRKMGVIGTLSKAEKYGDALLSGRLPHEASELFKGFVREIHHEPESGFHTGHVVIENEKESITLFFQNEFMEARGSDGKIVSAPTIINVLGYDRKIISTHQLIIGEHVSIITLPAPTQWIEEMKQTETA